MEWRLAALPWVVAAAWTAGVTSVSAQTTTASVSGIVRDRSGELLRGASVVATDRRTAFRALATTQGDGSYALPALPPGEYDVTAVSEAGEPAPAVRCPLPPGARVALDILLAAGTDEGPPDTRTGDADVGWSDRLGWLPGDAGRALLDDPSGPIPVSVGHVIDLTMTAPGVVQATGDAVERMTSLSVETSINGSRTNANRVTLDGALYLDSGDHTGLAASLEGEFVDQLTLNSAAGPVAAGGLPGAGIQFSTRSGTNRFTGGTFERLQRTSLNANEYFANLRGVEKPATTVDLFGGSGGGPLVPDRAFFFGGVEWKRVRRAGTAATRSLPTSAMRRGDFSAISTRLSDPTTGEPWPGNIVPSALITPDGRAIAAVYEAMAARAAAYDDSRPTDNAVFREASASDHQQDTTRVDVRAAAGHRLVARIVIDHDSLAAPFGSLINSPLPTVPTLRVRPGHSVHIADAWSAGRRVANEIVFDVADHAQRIEPTGDGWKRDTYGFAYPQMYAGGLYENSIPNVTVGGMSGFRGANAAVRSSAREVALGDTVTWHLGPHALVAGGLVLVNHRAQHAGSPYAGSLSFSTAGNSRTSGHAFADALLGNFRRYEEAQSDPLGRFRSLRFESFASDRWRVARGLTLEAGLRHIWYAPTDVLDNNIANFDPDRYSASSAATMTTKGTVVPGSGDRFNGLVGHGDLRPASGYYPSAHLWAPGASAAWKAPGAQATVVRAAASVSYGVPEENLAVSLLGNPPFVMSSTFRNGSLSNAAAAEPPAQPWGAIRAIDPDLRASRTWNWEVGVERDLPGSFVVDAALVGRAGRRLLRRPDINAPGFADLTANSTLKYSVDYWRPYKGYSEILMYRSDARSQYRGLQTVLRRNRGTLKMTASYTWSIARDNASTSEEVLEPGMSALADQWGASNHDRRQIFVATWAWQLPLGQNGGWKTRLLGGWQLAGTVRLQSGRPFTVTGRTGIGSRRADYLGGDPYRFEVDDATGMVWWLDAARFAVAPDTRAGNTRRNQFVGPPFVGCDLSLRKLIPLGGRLRMELEVDAFNALNRVNWNNPASSVTGATPFGTITSTGPARSVEIALRLIYSFAPSAARPSGNPK